MEFLKRITMLQMILIRVLFTIAIYVHPDSQPGITMMILYMYVVNSICTSSHAC